MKQIEAVIQQRMLHEVRDILDEIGVECFMESPIICHDNKKGQILTFRGAKFIANIVEKVKLDIVASDDMVDKIIDAIRSITKTGSKDDCHIGLRTYLVI